MRVGIIQSCYIPWRGFFDFIDDVDLFIVFDDVQYPVGRTWRNRNKLKMRKGMSWVTVPVLERSDRHAIDEVRIDDSGAWREQHRNLLLQSLGNAPHFAAALALWEECVTVPVPLLSELNVRLLRAICRYLEIGTPLMMARELDVQGAKSERLIRLVRKVDGDVYLSGPTAKGYLDVDMFRESGIRVEFKSYDYREYPQLWGNFVGEVSILDLIANCGRESREYLKSGSPNIAA